MPEVTANGVKLNYEEMGRGKPLVLVHHLGGNLLSWRNQLPEFQRHFRVIAYEIRGHGRSDQPQSGYEVSNQAKDLESLLGTLGISSCYLLGHSIGGQIAMRLTLDSPELVEKLVLVNTRPDPVPETARKNFSLMCDIARTQGMQAVAEHRRAKDELVKKLAEDPKTWEDFKRMYSETSVIGFVKCAEALGSVASFRDELGKIRTPTLCIVGSDDHMTFPYVEVMTKKIPKCTSIVMGNCGHFSMIESPTEFNAYVLAFLQGK